MRIIRHQDIEALDLAASCIEQTTFPRTYFYESCPSRPRGVTVKRPVKVRPRTIDKKNKLLSWTYGDVVRLAYRYYAQEWKGKARDSFFRGAGISRVSFHRLIRHYGIRVNRFYSVNGGQLFRMTQHRSDLRGWTDRKGGYRQGQRTGNAYPPALILELTHVHLSHYYDSPKQFNSVLDKVGISKNHYLLLRRKYGYKIQFFVQIDQFEIIPRNAGR